MKGCTIDKFYSGAECDMERPFPLRPKEELEEEFEKEKTFLKMLSAEQKKAYEEFSDLQLRAHAYCNDILYRRGFRAGAKMMMEILTEDE